MRRLSLFFFSIIFVFSALNAQNHFRYPINYKIRLSGSFGELRKNHFHTGIDIKGSGNWKSNKAIAVMDGYISRIMVKPDGYGNALYINHPNGITSVYAHLNNFNKKITEIVRKIQYANKTWEINPDSLHIPVTKGETLGQIGNTGRSFGAHLHFELRNTTTEHPVNPFRFGIKPKDNIKPTLSMLKIVALDTAYNVLNSKKIRIQKSKKGNFFISPSTIKYGAWRVGLEVLGFDKMSGAPNKNGIYSLLLKVNGEKVYQFKMDSLDFSKQNCLNAHIDNEEAQSNKKKYNRLYVLPGNNLEIYRINTQKAIIPLYENKSSNVEIVAKDYDGNTSILKFKLKRDNKIIEPVPKLYNQHLSYGNKYFIKTFYYKLKIEKKDLFKDMFLFISKSENKKENDYSDNISIFTNYEVFKNNVDLYIRPLVIDSLADKICIVKIDDKKITNLGNDIVDGYFHTITKTGGTFKIMPDTIAPTIEPVNYKNKKTRYRKISFVIKDNFDTGGLAKEMSYNGYIDDKWVLFTYDKKKNTITHTFDKTLSKGKHHLKIVVIDDRGNKNVFEKDFWR